LFSLIKLNAGFVFLINPVVGNYSGIMMDRMIRIIVHTSARVKTITVDGNNIGFTQKGKITESNYIVTKKNKLNKFMIDTE